jgi:hypothetical protein
MYVTLVKARRLSHEKEDPKPRRRNFRKRTLERLKSLIIHQ